MIKAIDICEVCKAIDVVEFIDGRMLCAFCKEHTHNHVAIDQRRPRRQLYMAASLAGQSGAAYLPS